MLSRSDQSAADLGDNVRNRSDRLSASFLITVSSACNRKFIFNSTKLYNKVSIVSSPVGSGDETKVSMATWHVCSKYGDM